MIRSLLVMSIFFVLSLSLTLFILTIHFSPFLSIYSSQTTKANATINIKVEIKTSDYIRICGDSAVNSMKNVIFYLIQNTATAPKQNVLPEKTTQWMHRKYAGDECTLLSGLPKGQHVLSLVCTKEGDTCALTHLVQYE